MRTPGPTAKLEGRKFYHLTDEDIHNNASEVSIIFIFQSCVSFLQVKGIRTVTGINRVFCYIVSQTGQVIFKKFPCFCENCSSLNYKDCKFTRLSGNPEVVVREGENIKNNKDSEDSE